MLTARCLMLFYISVKFHENTQTGVSIYRADVQLLLSKYVTLVYIFWSYSPLEFDPDIVENSDIAARTIIFVCIFLELFSFGNSSFVAVVQVESLSRFFMKCYRNIKHHQMICRLQKV